jgi:hypothetical protein
LIHTRNVGPGKSMATKRRAISEAFEANKRPFVSGNDFASRKEARVLRHVDSGSCLLRAFSRIEEMETKDLEKVLKTRAKVIEDKAISNLTVKNRVINLSQIPNIDPEKLKEAAKLALTSQTLEDLNLSVSISAAQYRQSTKQRYFSS